MIDIAALRALAEGGGVVVQDADDWRALLDEIEHYRACLQAIADAADCFNRQLCDMARAALDGDLANVDAEDALKNVRAVMA